VEITNQYEFFFVGGTGGSFVKSIFFYYCQNPANRKINLMMSGINLKTGDCHCSSFVGIQHHHWIANLDSTKKLILIDFDKDDKPTIIKMSFFKSMLPNIVENPSILKTLFGGILAHVNPTDFTLLEKIILSNPDYLIFPDWADQVRTLSPTLTIKFKDIMFGELNQIIADFFQVEKLPEIDRYIEYYREINKKYVDNTK
jgi:hypothetical protein